MANAFAGYCLITGAAGGIGRELVRVFSNSGYKVIAVDRNPPADALDCHAWYEFDLSLLATSESAACDFFAKVRTDIQGSGLAVLINNAAIQILGGVDSLKREDWKQTLDINLLAPFYLTQGMLEELETAKGSVVNISSIHARLTKKNFVAYATSKAALSALSRAMALDLGDRVRVNAIEMGAIETEMLFAGFQDDLESLNELKNCHPLGRIGSPSEVAKLALMLSSVEFEFIHGACISMDGGISARLHDPK